MIGAIKVAQEAIRSETGVYASPSTKLCINGKNTGSCYPEGAGKSDKKFAWGGWGKAEWDALNVQSTGPVQFEYSTMAGLAGQDVTADKFEIDGKAVPWATGETLNASPWYVVGAQANLDPRSTEFTSIASSSWQSGIMVDHEGE
jgi:hypothetical protein